MVKDPGSRSTSAVTTVTFDLDDTLWAVGPVIVNAEQALWRWLEEHCPEMTARYDRQGLLELRTRILEAHPALRHDISGMRLRVLARAIEDSGRDHLSASQLAAQAFSVFMDARHDIEYFDDAVEVLATLGERYYLGVLSNGNADVRRLDIGKYFDFAISAAGVASSKPEPHMFEAALRAAGCGPHEMVHIGDHHEHDVAGAQLLGIRTIWVNRTGEPFPGAVPANAEVSSLLELPGTLDALARRGR